MKELHPTHTTVYGGVVLSELGILVAVFQDVDFVVC